MILYPCKSNGGTPVIEGNATPADVRSGKTFMSENSPNVQTGTMPNKKGSTVEASTVVESGDNVLITIPQAGEYDTASKLQVAKSLLPSGGFIGALLVFGAHTSQSYKYFDAETEQLTNYASGYTDSNVTITNGIYGDYMYYYDVKNNTNHPITVVAPSGTITIASGDTGRAINQNSLTAASFVIY